MSWRQLRKRILRTYLRPEMNKNSELFVRRKVWQDLALHKVGLNGLMSHEVVDFEPPDVAQSVARS